MSFAFPAQLAERVVDRWHSYVNRGERTPPPLPPLKELREILETVFFASLEREEGRVLRFVVCCVPSPTVLRDGLRDRVPLIPLVSHRELSVSSLRALAPAARPESAAILVEFSADGGNPSPPRISGILHVGSDLVRARAGKSFHFCPPPYALMIEVRGPGELHVYQGAYKLAVLESGCLPDPSIVSALDLLPAMEILKLGERGLWSRIDEPAHEPKVDWLEFQSMAVLNTVLCVVNALRSHEHGGTLLLLEPTANVTIPVKLKYETNIDVNFLDDRFATFISARNAFSDALFIRENHIIGAPADDEVSKLHFAVMVAERELSDAAETVAAFGCVDGALLLTGALRLIGFGAEISLEQVPRTKVYEVIGSPLAKADRPELDSEVFGMRHRSAVRFIGATENAAAFIVSQDGKVSFCWKREGLVYIKRGVNIANPNMAGA